MQCETIQIPIDTNLSVSANLTRPVGWQPGRGTAVILAHGAANNKENPILVAVGRTLAEAGILTLCFNFPYADRGKKTPDGQKRLEATWMGVIDWISNDPSCQPERLVAAGKSMGGRVASQLAATQRLAVDALIFLGYPLHAPGRKDKLRDAHLPAITQPMLYINGSRDSFCDLSLLKPILNRLSPPPELVIIDNASHSLDLPKSQAHEQAHCHTKIANHCLRWLKLKASA